MTEHADHIITRSVGPTRWFLLAMAWTLLLVSMWLPWFVFISGDRWPGYLGLLFCSLAFFRFIEIGFSWLGLLWAVLGCVLFAAIITFVLSPLLLAFQHHSRFVARLSWIGVTLLGIWFPWLLARTEGPPLLYGYYITVTAFMLLLIAIIPRPGVRRSERARGFEPVFRDRV